VQLKVKAKSLLSYLGSSIRNPLRQFLKYDHPQMMFFMQALQFPFTRNEFHHELLRREGMVCLVKRSKPSHSHFEIVKLRVAPERAIFGKTYPERELYPADEDWGQNGFTLPFNQPDLANRAFELLFKMHSDVAYSH
jgi:hypothetical protein